MGRLALSEKPVANYTFSRIDRMLCCFRSFICREEGSTLSAELVIEKEGDYFIVVGFCDANTANVKYTARYEIKASYGHLPSGYYALLFTFPILCVVYLILLALWSRKGKNEKKNSARVIQGALLVIAIRYLLCFLYLLYVNIRGTIHDALFIVAGGLNYLLLSFVRCLLLCLSLGFLFARPFIRRVGYLGTSSWKAWSLIIGFGVVYLGVTGTCLVMGFRKSTDETILGGVVLRLWSGFTRSVNALFYLIAVPSTSKCIHDLGDKKFAESNVFRRYRTSLIIGCLIAAALCVFQLTNASGDGAYSSSITWMFAHSFHMNGRDHNFVWDGFTLVFALLVLWSWKIVFDPMKLKR